MDGRPFGGFRYSLDYSTRENKVKEAGFFFLFPGNIKIGCF